MMGFQFHLVLPVFGFMFMLSGSKCSFSSSVSNSYSAEGEQEECGCHCTAHIPWNITDDLLEMLRKDISDLLLLETKNLSKTIRKRTSAKDNRPSAVTMGSVGIVFFVLTMAVIVVPDVISGLRYLFNEAENRPKVLQFVSNVK